MSSCKCQSIAEVFECFVRDREIESDLPDVVACADDLLMCVGQGRTYLRPDTAVLEPTDFFPEGLKPGPCVERIEQCPRISASLPSLLRLAGNKY